MSIPSEIQEAIDNLTGFIAGGASNEQIRKRALGLLSPLWDICEQIPFPRHTEGRGNLYWDEGTLEFANVCLDYQTEREVQWAGNLIGCALDALDSPVKSEVWLVDTAESTWLEDLIVRGIEQAGFTSKDLTPYFKPTVLEKFTVKLQCTPSRDARILTRLVKELSADKKQELADLIRQNHQLPLDTTEGIFESLYVNVTRIPAHEMANLGAVAGLFYAIWLRLHSMS